VEKRHDVQPMPDLRAYDCADEADFFFQFSTKSIDVALTRLQPATRQGPARRRRELETHQQHALVGIDDERTDGLADAQVASRIARHSSGELLRPSLN